MQLQQREQTEPQSLSDWLRQTCMKLLLARGIDTPVERFSFFLLQLKQDSYSEAQRTAAEQWILRGNWQYKGTSAVLELADFYPTKDMLGTAQSGYVIVQHGKVRAMQQEAYQQGYQKARAELIEEQQATEEYKTLTGFVKDYTARLHEYKERAEQAEKKARQLEDRLDRTLAKLYPAEENEGGSNG